MRVNGRVTRHGNLDVHLHGVGGRTVPQVYHLDMQLGKKVFFFSHKFFKEKHFDRDGVHLNDDGNSVSITAFFQPFGWSCDAQLPPSCSDWYR
uniref:Uncharacterized protein n=1 Tax=Magallana gigas TaxID=29159 RepID=A0A8W8P554_MAGGI